MLLNSSNSCNRSGLVLLVEGHRECGVGRSRLFGTCCLVLLVACLVDPFSRYRWGFG